jgi:hypothetical protein
MHPDCENAEDAFIKALPALSEYYQRVNLVLSAATVSVKIGLPPDRRQRLPKVYRLRAHDDINCCFLWDFMLPGRLSPIVSG